MENQENKNKLFIYLLVVFFAIFVGSGIFLLINNKPKEKNQEQEAISTTTVNEENMTIEETKLTRGFLKLKTDFSEVKVGEDVDIDISADSDGENITAYDILLTYNPLVFDFVKAVSLDDNFQVYSYKKDDRLTLTVIKTSQDLTPSIFKEDPVIRLTFKPKKVGQYSFEIISSYDQEITKFVNDKTEVINPEVNKIDLIVK